MPAPSLYVYVALYIRLSVEDNKKRGCSVENQKLVLNDFLADKPDFVVYDTYIDNGLTDTAARTMTAPDFSRCSLILKRAISTV